MISIVIPTLNEELNIKKTLKKLSLIKNFRDYEYIIVDDNSKDNTLKEVHKFKKILNINFIKNKKRLGLGYALKVGYKISKNNFVLFLDADLSISNKDIVKLVKKKKVNSIIVGSRYLKNSLIIGAPYFKVLLSKLLNLVVSKVYKTPIIDISHSFRIISKNIPLISKNYSHPGFFWETTINAKRLKYNIEEIAIKFTERKYGVSKNKTLIMVKSVIKSLFNLLIAK